MTLNRKKNMRLVLNGWHTVEAHDRRRGAPIGQGERDDALATRAIRRTPRPRYSHGALTMRAFQFSTPQSLRCTLAARFDRHPHRPSSPPTVIPTERHFH